MYQNNFLNSLRLVNVTRYVMPLREGGSLPALAEADDEFNYVLKFKGAGQREKALIAELLGGELARRLGFKVPELVFANLDEAFGRSEGDEEIQDLLKSSQGLNLALHFLSKAMTFDPGASQVDEYLASRIVWFDAFTTNVDRTAKNVNLLVWHRRLRLIDHGAALYMHHDWEHALQRSRDPFERIRDHVLLPRASRIAEVDAELAARLTPAALTRLIDAIPAAWLADAGGEARRGDYLAYLTQRLETPRAFALEAQRAHAAKL
jgi:hypothetical protein